MKLYNILKEQRRGSLLLLTLICFLLLLRNMKMCVCIFTRNSLFILLIFYVFIFKYSSSKSKKYILTKCVVEFTYLLINWVCCYLWKAEFNQQNQLKLPVNWETNILQLNVFAGKKRKRVQLERKRRSKELTSWLTPCLIFKLIC